MCDQKFGHAFVTSDFIYLEVQKTSKTKLWNQNRYCPLNVLFGYGSGYFEIEYHCIFVSDHQNPTEPSRWAGGVDWSPRDGAEFSAWSIGPTNRYFLHPDSIGSFRDGESGCDKCVTKLLVTHWSHICHTLVTLRFFIRIVLIESRCKKYRCGSDGTPRHCKPSVEAWFSLLSSFWSVLELDKLDFGLTEPQHPNLKVSDTK